MSQDRADLIQQSSGSIYGQVYDDLMLRTFTGKSLPSQLVITSFFDVFIKVTACKHVTHTSSMLYPNSCISVI